MSASAIRHPLRPKNRPPADPHEPTVPNTTQKYHTTMSRILPLSAALLLLTACTPGDLPDGWYPAPDGNPKAHTATPIVTCGDFDSLRLDSLPSDNGTFIYQISGSVKPERRKRWAEATRKAVGRHLVFLYRGEIIAAPCIRMPMDAGTFSISSPELSGDADRMRQLFRDLEAQMR